MATISNDVGNAESEAGMDLDEIFLLFGIVIAIAVGLALWLYQKQVGQMGVGLIGSFTSPVTAVFNGIANAISAFFNWLARSLGNLFIYPAAKRALALYMTLKSRIMTLKSI